MEVSGVLANGGNNPKSKLRLTQLEPLGLRTGGRIESRECDGVSPLGRIQKQDLTRAGDDDGGVSCRRNGPSRTADDAGEPAPSVSTAQLSPWTAAEAPSGVALSDGCAAGVAPSDSWPVDAGTAALGSAEVEERGVSDGPTQPATSTAPIAVTARTRDLPKWGKTLVIVFTSRGAWRRRERDVLLAGGVAIQGQFILTTRGRGEQSLEVIRLRDGTTDASRVGPRNELGGCGEVGSSRVRPGRCASENLHVTTCQSVIRQQAQLRITAQID